MNDIFMKILSEYTDINKEFLKDFFGNFELENEDDIFYIKEKKVAKWLGIELQTLRDRLRNKYSNTNNYLENIDYVRVKKGKDVTYTLTYKCFEALAMMSETVAGQKVRGYFIKLREFLQNN